MLSFIYENYGMPVFPRKPQGMGLGTKLALGAGAIGAGMYGLSNTDWYKQNQEEWNKQMQTGATKQWGNINKNISGRIDTLQQTGMKNIENNHGFFSRHFGEGGDKIDNLNNQTDIFRNNLNKMNNNMPQLINQKVGGNFMFGKLNQMITGKTAEQQGANQVPTLFNDNKGLYNLVKDAADKSPIEQ